MQFRPQNESRKALECGTLVPFSFHTALAEGFLSCSFLAKCCGRRANNIDRAINLILGGHAAKGKADRTSSPL